MKSIAGRIKQIRFENGLSQEEFAEKIGVHRGYISNAETGKIKPSNKVAQIICSTFGMSKEWLINGEGARKKFDVDPNELFKAIEDIRYKEFIERVKFAEDGLYLARHKIRDLAAPDNKRFDVKGNANANAINLFDQILALKTEYDKLIKTVYNTTNLDEELPDLNDVTDDK